MCTSAALLGIRRLSRGRWQHVGYSVDQRVPENGEGRVSRQTRPVIHCLSAACCMRGVAFEPTRMRGCRVFKHAIFRGFVRVRCVVVREFFRCWGEWVSRFQFVCSCCGMLFEDANLSKRCGVGLMRIMVVMMIVMGMPRGLGGEDGIGGRRMVADFFCCSVGGRKGGGERRSSSRER